MIFPAITETLVLPISVDEVERRVDDGISNKKFVGVVGRGYFSLSAHLLRPPQFQPIVRGRIESSSRGSLVFVRYEMMPATKILLGFVAVILLGVSIGFSIEAKNVIHVIGAILVVAVIRYVALTNIKLHRNPVRQNLLDILS